MADDDRITLIIEGFPRTTGGVRLGLHELSTPECHYAKWIVKPRRKAATVYKIADFPIKAHRVCWNEALPKQPYSGMPLLGLGRVNMSRNGALIRIGC